MKIGSILENQNIEKRIAITPDIIKKYISIGCEITLSKDYGYHLGISNKDFTDNGAVILDDDKVDFALDNFNLKDWSDLHKFTYNLINKFDFYYDFLEENSKKLEKIVASQEEMRELTIIALNKTNSQKNYFILISIISQIISLLFLLFLFRSLLLINKSL